MDAESIRTALVGRDVPCWECGYNLRDCPQGVCPECGGVITQRTIRLGTQRPFDREAHRHYIATASLIAIGTTLPLLTVMAGKTSFRAWLLQIVLTVPLFIVSLRLRRRAVSRLVRTDIRPAHALPNLPLACTLAAVLYCGICGMFVAMFLFSE